MPRIPFPATDQMSEQVRARVGDDAPNVTRMLAGASEGVYFGFGAFAQGLMKQSALDPKLRELAILRVGYISKCAYELFQHEPFGRFVGLSDDQIAAIEAGDPSAPVFDEAQSAVLRFVNELVLDVRPSDDALAAVRQHLDDQQVIDLVLVTGNYMMVCRFLETTGIELDDNAIDWDSYTAGE